MSRNEEGEFELVLGNRQLLSVFFIVVVLLGVFFTMGYIVGRNSSPAGSDMTSRKADSSTNPIVVDPSSGKMDAAGRALQPGQAEVAPSDPNRASTSTVVVDPSKESRAEETRAPEPPKHKEPPPKPVETRTPPPPPVEKAEKKTPPAPAAHAAGGVGLPAKGTYLQVMAVSRTDADLMSGVLAKKGFHVVVAPGPNELLFRVLVGPCPDAASVGKTRNDLQAAGFKGAFVTKY